MTLPKTWLSASTSRWALGLLGAAGAGLTLLTGGCATHTRPALPPPLRGYVNLDALTRQHPGWSGVGRYDAALHRLDATARSLPPTSRPDGKIATLPALPPASGDSALPVDDRSKSERRLTAVQRSLLDGRRSRRETARADQIRSRQEGWRREARQRYPVLSEKPALQPDLALQLLQANIDTLTRTLDGWKQSVPPAPMREALRAKVEADRARLEALAAARIQARDAAQARGAAEVLRRRQARLAYVQAQGDALAARLRADDERIVAGQQVRLTRQRMALASALAQPESLSIPVAGDAGAQALPKGPEAARAALSRSSLMEAEKRLSAQRARWVRHLYDDTQAAARDAADQRRWDVTFGPPRPGDRDLTSALAQAMKAGAWRL